MSRFRFSKSFRATRTVFGALGASAALMTTLVAAGGPATAAVSGAMVTHPFAKTLTSISCPSSSECFAVSSMQSESDWGITRLTHDAATSTTHGVGAAYAMGSLSCPSAAGCESLWFNRDTNKLALIAINATGVPGTPRTVAAPGNAGIDTISCYPTRSHCTLVGAQGRTITIITVTGSHVVKHDLTAPASHGDVTVQGLDCATSSSCEADGYQTVGGKAHGFVLAINHGVGYEITVVPAASGFSSVACASAKICFAAGSANTTEGRGFIATITSGKPVAGKTLAAGTGLYGISCETSQTCVVVGSVTSATTHQQDGGLIAPIRNGKLGATHTTNQTDGYTDVSAYHSGYEAIGYGLKSSEPSVVTVS